MYRRNNMYISEKCRNFAAPEKFNNVVLFEIPESTFYTDLIYFCTGSTTPYYMCIAWCVCVYFESVFSRSAERGSIVLNLIEINTDPWAICFAKFDFPPN